MMKSVECKCANIDDAEENIMNVHCRREIKRFLSGSEDGNDKNN